MILRIGAITLAFLIAAIAMLPLRMAWATGPQSSDLAIASIDGTVWSGRIAGVSWRGHALGAFDTSLSPADLLPQPALHLTAGTGPLKSALLRASGDALIITRADIRMDVASLAPALAANATVRISNGEITLQRGICTTASGRIDAPAIPEIGLPVFTGALSCDRGVLLARLASTAGDVVLELSGGSQVSWRSASPALAIMLAAAGIAQSASTDT